MRADGRDPDELRTFSLERDWTDAALGSTLVRAGRTTVLCTVSASDRVPPWLRGTGRGWVTAEYSMLPGASPERVDREAARGRQSGRTQEIQRLIGRSLRSVSDLVALGERQLVVDCDVLQADGGTRTAAITGGFLALERALERLEEAGSVQPAALMGRLAAVSVGIVDGEVLLDLDYEEDARASVDLNLVMTDAGRYVEVQGTAEGEPFSKAELVEMLRVGEAGIQHLLRRGRSLA
jgi:ribonuclease PH